MSDWKDPEFRQGVIAGVVIGLLVFGSIVLYFW